MRYVVQIYLNGIYWDNTYTPDKDEAEKWKNEIEDTNHSIWDRVNGDALIQFVRQYNIANEESIKVTAKVVDEWCVDNGRKELKRSINSYIWEIEKLIGEGNTYIHLNSVETNKLRTILGEIVDKFGERR